MSPRPGTDVAGRFFSDCVDAEEWLRVLEKYDESLEMVAKSKKKIELIELDNFWRKEFSAIVLERSPPHFTLPELSKIMAWKLLRGKFRPLQKMCDSNSPESVISASTAALKAMQGSKADWKSAMKSLTTLRAIGEATASALLAPLFPKDCPFMSDEALDVSCGSREYTAKAYTVLQSSLSKKAKELGGSCTAESVGKVLWIISIFAANGKEVNSSAGKSAKSESVKRESVTAESVKSDSAKLARDEEENAESDLPKRSKRRKTG